MLLLRQKGFRQAILHRLNNCVPWVICFQRGLEVVMRQCCRVLYGQQSGSSSDEGVSRTRVVMDWRASGLVLRIFQFQGDIDFAGASGRPLDVDLVPGRSQAMDWGVPEAMPFEAVCPTGFLLLDCIHMLSGGEFALLSERARAALGPLFEGHGEFLPLRLVGRSYWWFNCSSKLDCFHDAGRGFNWAAPDRFFFEPAPAWPFDATRITDAPAVFRVPQVPVGEVFVRDEVAAAVATHGLVGFDLRLVWPETGSSKSLAEQENLSANEREQLVRAKRAAMAALLEARGPHQGL